VPPTPSDPEITESVDERGLSRRSMMKKAAAAGAVAWTAPVIIDSLVSPAAAVTHPPCSSCTNGTSIGQASFHVTNTGNNGTVTCPATSASAPSACRPTCYVANADDCSVPFSITSNKSGNSVGVVLTMNGGGTFLGGTTYSSATACLSTVGAITSPGGTSTITFAPQTANTGYDISVTWCL
jgi:hypothetical protein